VFQLWCKSFGVGCTKRGGYLSIDAFLWCLMHCLCAFCVFRFDGAGAIPNLGSGAAAAKPNACGTLAGLCGPQRALPARRLELKA